MADVIALGELLIDFVATVAGVTLAQAPAFEKAAGGAPANVAVGLARLGVQSAFLGKVGNDPFGHFLAETLSAEGVDVTGLHFSDEARTALAFVSLRSDGERDFMFYRHPSADMLHHPDEIPAAAVAAARILHVGSISLIREPSRSATLHAVAVARAAGRLVSYDPNLRLALWPDAETARAGILAAWPLAHVIKVSEEELAFLSHQDDLLAGAQQVWHEGLRLLVVTRGMEGCTVITRAGNQQVPSFPVRAVDTTGAGDGFVAGLLKGLLETPEAIEEPPALARLCRYANAVGALTTTQRGAIPALPRAEAVTRFLKENEREG